MTPEQISMVQATFGKVAANKDAAAALFYARLFELDPSLKPMFKGDLKSQGQKLMGALAIAVGHLRNPEVLLAPLRDMGARHRGYGVEDHHYDTVASALIWTLEQGLGADFTAEVKHAWVETYILVAGVMKQNPARAVAA